MISTDDPETQASSPAFAHRGRCYFHHIPRTAGTTLRNHLIRQMGEERVAPMIRGMSLHEALREYAAYDAITGHVAAVPGDRLPPDRLSVTLLRDPVERVISEYHFSPTVHASGARALRTGPQTFDDWVLARSAGDAELLNAQVTLLWPLGRDTQIVPAGAVKLAAAKRALDRFDLVGIQDQIRDSVAMLDFLMGWPGRDAVAKDNAGPARRGSTSLASSTLARLQELLAPDLELFSYARARFADQRSAILVKGARVNAGSRAAIAPDAIDASASRAHVGPRVTERAEARGAARTGTGEIVIRSTQVIGDISGPDTLQTGEWATIAVIIDSAIVETNLTIGVALRDHAGALVFGTNTRLLGRNLSVSPGQYLISFRFPNELGLGRYSVTATAHRGNSHLERCFHWRENACAFEIANAFSDRFEGRMRLHFAVYAQAESRGARLTVSDVDDDSASSVVTLGRRNPTLSDFRALLTGTAHLGEVKRGADLLCTLSITNSGSERWGAYGRQPVQVSYHWLAADGSTLVFEGLRTALPHDVLPGQELTVKCFVRVPDLEGDVTLRWTMVQEEVTWFDAQDADASFPQGARIVS